MSRRTKEGSAETRDAIIDAAEALFDENGVARTSLEAIASAAKVTRGAIYWHFRDKEDLFRAMQDRARLPQEQFFESRVLDFEERSLDALYEATIETICRFVADARARRVYTIILFRCEYVGALRADLMRCEADDRMRGVILNVFRRAEAEGTLSPDWPAWLASEAYFCALVGLFSEWLRRDGEIDIVAGAKAMLSCLFAGFRSKA